MYIILAQSQIVLCVDQATMVPNYFTTCEQNEARDLCTIIKCQNQKKTIHTCLILTHSQNLYYLHQTHTVPSLRKIGSHIGEINPDGRMNE